MLRFQALGGLTVTDDGNDVAIGGPRQRRLIAMLLVHRGAVVSADRLADAVFAGQPTPGASTTLRSYVARLRRVVDGNGSGPTVVTRAPGYMLLVPDDGFDVARFERLVAEGRSDLAHDDPVAAECKLRDALSLWRGDAYAEFADEEWAHPEAERLGELRLAALEDLVEARLACGRAAEVIPPLEAMVNEHPLREALRAHLMLALYRAGRQADALRSFQQYRTLMVDEMGLDPSPELTELERRILSHDPTLQLDETAGVPLRGYRLGERLGTGRTGTVHAARLPGVDRDIAIRIVRRQIADDAEFVRSFEADARRLAALRHEAIVPIHDYWREPGAAYLVMRRMTGGTLRDRLDRGPLGATEVTALVARVGSALSAAAAVGITHGGLVPESVLLDDAGDAYLSDFALGTVGDRRFSDDVREFAALIAESLGRRPANSAAGREIAPAVDRILTRARSPVESMSPDELVASVVEALTGKAAAPVDTVPNPYKGLRAFEEADAADFFGRAELVDEILRRLALERLILVVGGSGSGKSSVVRAGVLPRLRLGEVPGSDRWFVTALLPGASPFTALAEGLRHVAVTDTVGLTEELAFSEGGIDQVLRRLVPDGGQLVLVVDQFEELFTLAPDAEQRAFLDGVVHALSAPDSRLRVVATLRADFYDRPLRFHRFGALVRNATVTVPAMSAADLEGVVAGPAERVGARVDPPLVAELVAAVVDEPAALPSLQYTLYELAERSPDRALTLTGYRNLGGVDAAIAARAEHLYLSLDDEDRDAVRRTFERLVVVGTEGEPTRRRAPRSELAQLIPGRSIDDTVEPWVHARLLTSDRHPATREPTVEVAHEALLREWPRLRGWIEEDRDALLAAGQLREDAAAWDRLDRDPDALYRGAKLEVALARTDGRADVLPARERAFLDAGREERDREGQREQERVARQARANRRLRIQLVALAAAFVVAATVGFVAVDQRRRAEHEERTATARELAAAAAANLEADPERSVLLALEAVEMARSDDGSTLPEAEEALHNAVAASRAVLTVPGVGGAVDWSPDGTVFVTEGPEDTGLVDVRDARTGEAVRSWVGHDVEYGDGDINNVAFNHGGTMFATAGADGTARVWDPGTGAELWTLGVPAEADAVGLSFSPDDARLAVMWPRQGVVRIYDLATGRLAGELPAAGAAFATFSPDGERLLLVGEGLAAARVVVARTGEEVMRLEGHRSELRNGAWSPDGRWIATTSYDATARIWDARTGEWHATLAGHASQIDAVDWSPDSTRLLTGSLDGTARLWRIAEDTAPELLTLSGQGTRGGVPGVAFSPDGERVMTGTGDISATTIWDVSLRGDAEWANLPAVPAFFGVAGFTPDGERLVSSTADGSATVWDAETGDLERTLAPPDREGSRPPDPFAIDRVLDGSSGAEVQAIEVSPDGKLVATARTDGLATIWDAASGEEVSTFGFDPRAVAGTRQSVTTTVYDVGWSPDSELLATAGVHEGRGIVSIVDRSGEVVSTLRDQPAVDVRSVQFRPDGRRVVTARVPWTHDAESDGLWVWDWEHSRVVAKIRTSAQSAAFDPSGTRLVTVSPVRGYAEIWDVPTEKRVRTLEGPEGILLDAQYSHDGSTIATAGLDGSVRLWDAASGAQTIELPGHIGIANSVAFSPDDSKLVSVSADGTTRVWALDLDDLIEIAEREVTRDLTDAECRQYLHLDRCPGG
jgi:WD40 repeat protein/DNA-binding SARP family transcriptional activator